MTCLIILPPPVVLSRWLSVKNWLVHHKKKIEPASKRSWKNYWVCLKGTMLLFYTCEENEAVREDSVPRHMLGMYTVQHNPSFKVPKSRFCAIFAHILSKKSKTSNLCAHFW